MMYYVNGMILNSEEIELCKIGEGNEGSIYRIGDSAVKIYDRACLKIRLGRDAIDILNKIPTNRILMPQFKVTNQEGNFCGYATKYIENIPLNSSTYPIGSFLRELLLYEQDVKLLNDAGVSTADMTFNNVVYSKNNGIYMIDPGSFNFSNLNIVNNNYNEVNRLFAQILSLGLENEKQCRDLYMALSNCRLYDRILNTMDNENESIQKYALKMIKR